MRKKVFFVVFLLALILFGMNLFAQKVKDITVNDTDTETTIVFSFDSSNIVFPDVLRDDSKRSVIKLLFKEGVFEEVKESVKTLSSKGAFKKILEVDDNSIDIEFSDVLPFKISGNESNGTVILKIFKENENNGDVNEEKAVEKERIFLSGVEKKVEDGKIIYVFKFYPEIPKYDIFYVDNPRRLVIDLYNSIDNSKKPEISGIKSKVEKVRIGQNRLSPKPVTRVVFDLIVNEIDFSTKKEGNGLIITVKNINSSKVEKVKIKDKKVIKKKKVVLKRLDTEKKIFSDKMDKNVKRESLNKKEAKIYKVVNEEKAEPQGKFEAKRIHSEEKKYTGELVTLRFKDADIRDVLRQIAVHAGLNLIIDPGVTGKVTCELVALPWDQALDLILRSNNLGYIREGNVLRVGKVEVLTREEERRRMLLESKKLAGPLEVLTRTLSYAKAKNLKQLLDTQLSSRGKIIVDDRTNTLIISDVKGKIKIIDKLIDTLDTPNLQVTISARIVETTTNYSKNLGIQWGFKGVVNSYYGNQTNLQFPNNVTVAGNAIRSQSGIYGPLEGYAVNLPAPGYSSGIGISLGNVLDTFRLDAALTALEDQGKARILSTPTVTTQDNTKAAIIQGQMIPVQTVAYNTVTTRYVNAALELHVTPHITAEGTVIMDIEIKNDNADFSHLVNGIPPIITQSAKTTVLVKDGGTTVIGGIYKVENSETQNRVPGLSKLPIIGYLFRGSQKVGTNRELLIFITPRIVK